MKQLKDPNLLPIENPGVCIVQVDGNDNGSLYLDLCGETERVTLPYSLLRSSQGIAGFGQAVVEILADCGIAGDDTTQVSEVLDCN